MSRMGLRNYKAVQRLPENPAVDEILPLWHYSERRLKDEAALGLLLGWRKQLIEFHEQYVADDDARRFANSQRRQQVLLGRFAAMKEYKGPGADRMCKDDCYRKISNYSGSDVVVRRVVKVTSFGWKYARYRICLPPADWAKPLFLSEGAFNSFNYRSFQHLSVRTVFLKDCGEYLPATIIAHWL
jgi:hypothetical protein